MPSLSLYFREGQCYCHLRLTWHFLGFPRGSASCFKSRPASKWFRSAPKPTWGRSLKLSYIRTQQVSDCSARIIFQISPLSKLSIKNSFLIKKVYTSGLRRSRDSGRFFTIYLGWSDMTKKSYLITETSYILGCPRISKADCVSQESGDAQRSTFIVFSSDF